MSKQRVGSQCISVSLPELLQIANYAKQIQSPFFRIKSKRFGQRPSRLQGKGMEFEESRFYQIGDDIRSIDWRITARTGKTHTKLFREEKERPIFLCTDMSSTMFFATKGVFKSVQASLMASYIGWQAVLTGNRLGGLIFNETSQAEFRPLLGKKSLLPFLQKLITYQETSNSNTRVNLINQMDEATLTIQRLASPGSLIYFISDFRNLSPESYNRFIQIGRQSDVCLCLIYDQFEVKLPEKSGYFVTQNDVEIEVHHQCKTALKSYENRFKERKQTLLSLTQFPHMHFIELDTQQDCFETLKNLNYIK